MKRSSTPWPQWQSRSGRPFKWCRAGWLLIPALAFSASISAADFHLDPSHPQASDGGPGSETAPFATLSRALAEAGPGVTIRIAPGVWQQPLDLAQGGSPGHSFTLAARVPGSVVFETTTAATLARSATPGAATDVILDGIVFRGAAQAVDHAAVEPGARWTLRRCRVSACFAGILIDSSGSNADQVSLIESVVEDCASFGILARGASDLGIAGPAGLNILRSIVRRCQTAGYGEGSYAAGIYADRCATVTVRDCALYDNGGPGLWLDDGCDGFQVTGNTVFGNHSRRPELAAGIHVSDTTAGGNTLSSNLVFSHVGPGLILAESSSITVSANDFLDNGNAISLRNYHFYNNSTSTFTVPSDTRLGNLTFIGNRIVGWRAAAVESWPQSLMSLAHLSSNNIILDLSIYQPPSSGLPLFRLLDDLTGSPAAFTPVSLTTLAAVQSATPFEDHGSVSTVPLPPGTRSFVTTAARGPQLANSPESISLAAVWNAAVSNQWIALPVFGRGDITDSGNGGSTTVHDLAARTTLDLTLPGTAATADLQTRVSRFAMWEPAWIVVRKTGDTTATWQARPFAAWQAAGFTPAEITEPDSAINPSLPGADPDGDGLVNLLEYLLGLDPRESDVRAALTASRAATGGIEVCLTVPPDRVDVVVSFQTSDDLETWLPVVPGMLKREAGEANLTWRWNDPAERKARFVRATVSLLP